MQLILKTRLLLRPLALLALVTITATLLTTRTALAQSNNHTVQPGESLSAIARKYGTDVSTLMRINEARSRSRSAMPRRRGGETRARTTRR